MPERTCILMPSHRSTRLLGADSVCRQPGPEHESSSGGVAVRTDPSVTPDEASREFAERMLELMNHGLLAVLVSIGHRTRLFDTMAETGWVTSHDLAGAAGLEERYVREWLGAMACGKIVELDPDTGRFLLPDSHARRLTRSGGPANIAPLMTMVSFLAPVEDEIVRCFREGGGLGYEMYPKFAKAMAIQSRAFVDAALLDGILPLVDGLADRLHQGIDVCDAGCGAGHAVNVMARAFPESRFLGIDLLSESIEMAQREAEEWGLGNVRFEKADLAELEGEFDLVTAIVAVHDQAKPQEVLERIHDVLRPGGTFLCLDSHSSSELAENLSDPLGAWRYSVSTLHCMSVSLAQGGVGLGDCWGPPLAVDMIHDAGFDSVELATPDWLDMFHVYVASKASDRAG